MSLFLSESERSAIHSIDRSPQVSDFYWGLLRRVDRRAESPGLFSGRENVDWYRPVAEYFTDAAMAHALRPTDATSAWLRDVTLSLVRRPADDWVGPTFRNHQTLDDGSQIGHLETAHFCWAIAVVVDLADDLFTPAERREVYGVLRDRGVKMCLNWLDRPHSASNWWCVLTAGIGVAAAVLDDHALIARTRTELAGCRQLFQNDGSYGESLQYGNYALSTMMLAGEALRRRGNDGDDGDNGEDRIAVDPIIGFTRWAVASYLYSKPTTGWGSSPKPRSLNFNDSAAVFKPTPDLLLYFATRGKKSHPREAGLARWLFDETSGHDPSEDSLGLASFGFCNTAGFLTLPLLTQAAAPLSPRDAELDEVMAFDCGNSIARDAWDGRTVLAMHGGGQPLNATAHCHRDLNSVILVHNRQRLLTDAGHSCYRNLHREIEVSTATHNTCTFQVTPVPAGPNIPTGESRVLEQREPAKRIKHIDRLDRPVARGAHHLIAASCDDVRVLGSDAAASYGHPIERFARFTILCGSHAVFVVDYITAADPVRARWHWLLNNRDGELDWKIARPDCLVARRGQAGMKLFSRVNASAAEPRWTHVNDAYHCLPGQSVEGRSGSGILINWTEKDAATHRIGVHAVAIDSYGNIGRWHLREADGEIGLESPGASTHWQLNAQPDRLTVTELVSQRQYEVVPNGAAAWALNTVVSPLRES